MGELVSMAVTVNCAPIRTAAAANARAEWFGVCGKVSTLDVAALVNGSRSCYWCGKSLGRKQTASLDHLRSLRLLGPNTVENLRVCCATCFDLRRRHHLDDPLQFCGFLKLSEVRTREIEAELAHLVSASLPTYPPRAVIHHRRAAVGGPWLFLAGSKSEYENSLQHFKLTSEPGRVRFLRVSEASPFRGLVTGHEELARRMLDELGASCRVVTWPSPNPRA